MSTQLQNVTADELLAMPEDGMRRELVAGELREMTPVGRQHARLARNLIRSLDAHVFARGLGEVYPELGFILESDPDTVRAPDVSFVRADRVDAGGAEEGYYRGVPDLAIEVISPNDRYSEVTAKVDQYLDHGTPMVVVVDPPRRKVTVYRPGTSPMVLAEQDVLLGERVVPGWTLPVRDIFA